LTENNENPADAIERLNGSEKPGHGTLSWKWKSPVTLMSIERFSQGYGCVKVPPVNTRWS